jgi:hypothetical protein
MTSVDCLLDHSEEIMQHTYRSDHSLLAPKHQASDLVSEAIHPGKPEGEQEEVSEVLSTLRRLRLM